MPVKQVLTTAGTALLVVMFITLAVVLGNPKNSTRTADNQSLQAKAKAPTFSLQTYNGKTVTMDDLNKPITVLNIWASWCPFCTEELPHFAKLQKLYPNKVQVVAINRGESRETAQSFTDRHNLTEDMMFLLNPTESYYRKIGGFAMPETLFLNADKNIFKHHRGPLSLQKMKKIIQSHLASPQESASRSNSYGCLGGQCRTTSSTSSINHGN